LVGHRLIAPFTVAVGRGPACTRRAFDLPPPSLAERSQMRHVGLRIVIAILFGFAIVRPSFAIQQFYMQYKKDYLDNHSDKEYVETVNKASNRCFVCHQGKNRKHRNAFGEHLAELLDWKKDAKDKDKIAAALKRVVAMHVDPKDEKSETYMDRIRASKWPAGELKDLQKEPEKKDGEKEEEGEK
jgi:hypothetical protein